MRKYFQIFFFLGVFGLTVVLRQFKGNDETPVVGKPTSDLNSTPTVIPTSTSIPTPTTDNQSNQSPKMMMPTSMPMMQMGKYKNGTYTGSVEDAFYGNIQVQAVITNGKLTDVIFLQYPNDNRTSIFINTQAMPLLKQEAIQAQSGNVDIVSGASDSSMAFQKSMSNALSQAI